MAKTKFHLTMELISKSIKLQDSHLDALHEAKYTFEGMNDPNSPTNAIWLSMIATTDTMIQDTINDIKELEKMENKVLKEGIQTSLDDLFKSILPNH